MKFTFDPPETGWTASLGADIRADATAPTQPNICQFTLGHSGIQGGTMRRTLSGLVVGQTYPVYMRVNFDEDMDPTQAQIRVLYRNSIIAVFYRNPDVPGDPIDNVGWDLRFIGNLPYSIADRELSIEQWGAEVESGNVRIDTIYIGELPWELQDMPRKWNAVSAAVTVLKGINGVTGNYNNDLGSRVYTRLFTPQEKSDTKLPYACFPIDQEAEKIEYEGLDFQSSWRLSGHAFFADNSENDPLNSTGATAAAKFRDDIIRAFMADQHLGGEVINCEVTAVDTSAGIVDDGISEVIFTIEFLQIGSAADLAAT